MGLTSSKLAGQYGRYDCETYVVSVKEHNFNDI